MSELDQAPISPREAAAFIAGQQSREELPVSDGADFLTGHRGVEASQGYTEMVSKNPVGGEDAAIDSAELGQKILEKEAQVAEPTERAYYRDGDATAPRTPAHETVSVEQASADVTRARQQDAAELEALEAQQLAQEIDRLRGYDPTAQQQAQPEPQPQTAPQPEQTPQGDFDLAAEFQKNPRLLNAVQETVNQTQAQAVAAERYYTNVVRQNAVLASAALVAAFPELQNLTPEQIPVAIKATLAADPDRARNMMRQIEATKDVMQQHQQVQQAQAQAYQQAAAREWQNYSRQNDDAYDAWSAYRPEAEVKAVKENVTRIMKEAYGVDEATLGHLYQTVPAFRSVQVQRMLHDLTVAHLARENIDAKRDRSYPVVQRPGSPEAREPEQNYRQRQLSSRLDGAKGQDALRIAAEMVTARRNARR